MIIFLKIHSIIKGNYNFINILNIKSFCKSIRIENYKRVQVSKIKKIRNL